MLLCTFRIPPEIDEPTGDYYDEYKEHLNLPVTNPILKMKR